MILLSRDFGEIDIEEKDIIFFPNGIFAFEENRKFALLSPLGENVYPMWLQSIENPELCFIVFNPCELVKDYSVTLDFDNKTALQLDLDDVLEYLVISVIPPNYQNATVNLKSPVVVNSSKNLAIQVIAFESYPLKHPVFQKEDS